MTRIRIARQTDGFSLDVDFETGPGVTALFGPPGAGKTLILEAVAGFVRPDSGRILLDDAILYDGASHVFVPARRRQCGYVAQSDALFPHMTVRQNLEFPAKRWPRLERHRRVAEMLERFHLAEVAPSRPGALTPPMRLRVAAARALIAEPKLLLLDDCGIDEPLLREIRAAAGIPILMVTGSLDLCCAAAGEMVVLDGGRILQRGAPRQVLDQPRSVEVARLLGIPNIFPATVGALDPGRDSSRLELEQFALNAPYIPGHFKGDRVWVAAAAEDLRVHSGDVAAGNNYVPVELVCAAPHSHAVLLEFSHGIFVNVTRAEFAGQKDNKSWQVEFPPEALRVL